MTPEEYKHLKAFEMLLESSIQRLENARDQATLAMTAEELESQWRSVHDEFAEVLGGIKQQATMMPYAQSSKVSEAVVGHLRATLQGVKAQLSAG